MARTISRCWGVSVGAAHTREPRLSAALLALGKIIFLRIKEGLWEEYLPPVHGRRHPVDRQGRPVDIEILPVNGQSVLVDILILSTRWCVLSTRSNRVEMRHPVDRQRRPVDIEFLLVDGQSVLVDMSMDHVNKEMCPVNTESSCRDETNACRQALSCGHAI